MSKKFSPKVSFVQKVVIHHPKNDTFLILVRKSNDRSRPSDIDVPGGSVREGEAHDAALKREVLEETNLQITNIEPLIVKSQPYEDDYFLFIGYKAQALSDTVTLEPNEHEHHEWISTDDFRNKHPDHILNELIERL